MPKIITQKEIKEKSFGYKRYQNDEFKITKIGIISKNKAEEYLKNPPKLRLRKDYKNISNQKFGHTIALISVGTYKQDMCWLCLCDCGNYHLSIKQNLWNGKIISCGCYRKTHTKKLTASKVRIKAAKTRRIPKPENSLAERCQDSLVHWDYDKNRYTTPHDINFGNKDKYWFKCENYHESYLCSSYNFYIGRRCPICKESKLEQETHKILDKLNIKYEREYDKFNIIGIGGGLLRFDFYLLDYNVAIECQGIQHYDENKWYNKKSSLRTQKHDKIKRKFCKQNNIKLIEIKYDQYENINTILMDIIKL